MAGLLLLALLGCDSKIGTDLDDTGVPGDGGAGDGGTADGGDDGGFLDVELLSPEEGQWYDKGVAITVLVQVSDPLGGEVEGLALDWSGAALVDVAPAAETDAMGQATFTLSPELAVGLHALSVVATRDDGALGLDSVAFEVVDPDTDLDGYRDATYGGDDCDDTDPTINPAAEEFCDDADNDCDGFIDEEDAVDILTWYEDLDADGYGKTDVVEIDCDQPKDFVLTPGDCDDTDIHIHPGAAEVCDEVDNDCDGLVDDEDDSLETASGTPYYPDADEDGWGDYSEYTLACEPPEGWTETPGDCDDDDPAISPYALEYCDGLDNNCLYGVDEDTAVDALPWYADADLDDYGVDDDIVWACDQPSGASAAPGDCDDEDPAVNPGAEEVCNDGVDSNCDGTWTGCQGDLLAGGAVLLGEASLDEAGYAVAPLGDLDGDGIDDVAVGARSADGGETDAGATYLVLGPVSGTVSLADALARVDGTTSEERSGRSVDGGVDADGDGVGDLLIARPNLDEGGGGAGGAALVSGEELLGGGTLTLDDALHRWVGAERYGYLGVGVYLVDVDADGAGDVLLGGNSLDANGSNSGAIALYLGPFEAGETDVGDGTWEAWITGEAAGDQVATAVEASADLDGDGVRDLVVGSSKHATAGADAGAVYLVSGMPSGSFDLADADARVTGEAGGDLLGSFVRQAGDHDGDGRAELLTGAPGSDATELEAGTGYVLLGAADLGAYDGLGVDAAAWVLVRGASTSNQLGSDGDARDDHDGDGVADLALGAPYDEGGGVHLFLGPLSAGTLDGASPAASWTGDTSTDGAGLLVRYAGSLGGTDVSALIVGARGADVAATDAGALLLVAETGL